MHEIELKFGIEPARLAAVRQAVQRPDTRPLRLRAAYYDTADGRLAAAGMALRLRQEGRAWMQTLKQGLDPMRRLEHNVPIVAARGQAPGLDPALHDGTPAGEALRALLVQARHGHHGHGEAAAVAGAGEGHAATAALACRFATDVTRHTRLLRGRGATAGTTVELALDEGSVFAGPRRETLCELEFELVAGSPIALIELARQWTARLGLWLDVRSKSWRGEYLAQGRRHAPAAKASVPGIPRHAGVQEAWRAVLHGCLQQVLVNASQIAGGEGGGEGGGPADAPAATPPPDEAPYTADHVHQLRVGLRRLRSALRLFRGQVPMSPHWNERLVPLFAALGRARDRDVFAAEVLPALQAAGAPDLAHWVDVPVDAPAEAAALGALLRDPGLTLLWLELLAATQEPPTPPPEEAAAAPAAGAAAETGRSWRDLAAERLQHWRRQMRRCVGRLDRLSDDELH
jgi:triphosphatase